MNLLWFVVAVYCGTFIALATMQRSFMYHPDRYDEAGALRMAATHGVLPWRDASGKLIGWRRVGKQPARNRLLILHGNGGSALARTYFMDGLGKLDGGTLWEFYALEYPGYGWREGTPTESSIVGAVESALQELTRTDTRPLYIAGESLGTGVGCILASRHPDKIHGLFLATPYTSTTDVAVGRFPMFPVRAVMLDRYDAATALKQYSGPVAMLLAGNDYIIPTRFGQKLYDEYSGPKKLWIQPNAGHNTLDYDPHAGWWKEVSDFLLHPAGH